jgi:type I restriction enzyme R subunit
MVTPEELSRKKIDLLLEAAGWVLQDMKDFNRNASLGVAVREFSLVSGRCDYLIFVDGKAAGVIEAKKEGVTLSGVETQTEDYNISLPGHVAKWYDTLPLPLAYESTGIETYFRDIRDPKPRSRRVFAFHKPETLLEYFKKTTTLRERLKNLPPLDEHTLRDCQINAIKGLEKSFAGDHPRSLIQMATGAGKTFTACKFTYRLIRYAEAKRVLFLVDRNNLGDQTLKEFQNFELRESGRRFTDTYITQHLHSNRIDPDAKVVITTIQRLFSMLKGEELDPNNEDPSGFETWTFEKGEIAPVAYNPNIPIETFDFIITDECHRSIYGLWRQVLEYFDSHIIGLTATPSKHTLGFFNQNLVAEYPYERSVADGVNVGFEVYRIRTKVSEEGSKVEAAGYQVPIRDRCTRAIRYKQLDENLEYAPSELDRTVTAPNQIRTIIQCYKDRLFTDLFPGRSGDWVPKTLIFAKDDSHAEDIVHLTREVFSEGNDFCKKITYRNTTDKPKTLIKSFRVDPMPRIAVTVDMIATGTDIKPVEVLIFMRDVKSEAYFEQMKGRGVRTIRDADLKSVTPDAQTKTRFILIDAVGVTEGKKNISQPLERKRNVAFDKLIDQVSQGRRDEDALSSLAGRLAALEKKLDPEDKERISNESGGISLNELSNKLLDAVDPDKLEEIATTKYGKEPSEETLKSIQNDLIEEACRPFDDPKLRQLLKDVKQKSEIIIDELTTDQVLDASYDMKIAEDRIASFKEFIEKNKNELLALQILYNQPYGKQRLTYASIKELTLKLSDPPFYLATADVWQAYKRLDAAKVRGAPVDKQLTEIISLVRFSLGMDKLLEPFGIKVEQRFNLWIGRQKNAGREFSDEQAQWLKAIALFIGANAEINMKDFQEIPAFVDKGGVLKARALFGTEVNDLIDDLQTALVA